MIRNTIHQIGVWTVRIVAIAGAMVAACVGSKDTIYLFFAVVISFGWLDEDAPELVDEKDDEQTES